MGGAAGIKTAWTPLEPKPHPSSLLMIPETISKQFPEFGADEIDSLLKSFAEWYNISYSD